MQAHATPKTAAKVLIFNTDGRDMKRKVGGEKRAKQ
jgi:hypothetical protein